MREDGYSPYSDYFARHTRIERSGISAAELREKLAGIAGHGRVLMLLDTCSSGAATGEGRPATGVELKSLLAGTNVTVLASSGEVEVSRESDTLGHGAFTAAMIEALGQEADSDRNGMISVGELGDFLGRRLPELTDNGQTPAIETRFGGDIFASGL